MANDTHTEEAAHGAADAGHGAADMAHAAAGHGESAGMPQLDFSTFGNQIFWLMLTLLAIYFILTRIALPRISSVLSHRQGQITGDIAAAEDLKQKAVEAEEAYNKALIEARAEAAQIVEQTKAEIKADLDAATAKADAEIAAKASESEAAIAEIRKDAVKSVKAVAKDTAKEIVGALGGKADAKAITAAITERMKG
ncbi:MAG: F0F1 ATP synthase subunit B' [Halocynthiibacter sp.]